MLRATLKGLLAHKFRLALTAVAVVLGVAFVAGTLVLTDTIAKAFDEVFSSAQEGVDVEVRAEASAIGVTGGDRERIPEELLSVIQRVEGVDRVEGGVTGYAQIVDEEGEAIGTTGAPTFGVSWPLYEGFSALSIREGRSPQTGGEVVIDAATAERHGFSIGDDVTILFEGPQEEFQLVGIAGFGDADNLAGATMAGFDLATAQRVLGAGETFDSIFVAADEGVRAGDLRDLITEVLPEGVEAQTGAAVAAEQADAIKEALGFFNTFLLVFAAIALFVGAFIIFNTFNILVTQRTRELALLRALGASSRQVTMSVLTEAGVVGLAASVVGLGLGILVAVGLRALLAGFGIDLPSASLQVLPRTIVVAFLVGIVVTVVAALLPARRAARISPIAAMQVVESTRPFESRRRLAIGGTLVVGGAALGLLGLFGGGGSAVQAVGIGVAATFIGTAILSPLIAQPLARAIGSPLPRLARLPGKLGRENAMRNPRRTAATSAALMVGLALVGTFLILGSSLKTSVGQTIETTLRADYVIQPGAGTMAGFSPELAGHLADSPDVAAMSPLRFGQWREEGSARTSWLSGVDPAAIEQVLFLDVVEGDVASLDERGVLVREDEAAASGLEVGDTLRMEFGATGVVPMDVRGIYREGWLAGTYLISLEAYEANYTEQLDNLLFVKTAPSLPRQEARAAIAAIQEAFPGVEVQDQAELRRSQEQQVNSVLGMVTALLGLAILIALLGIVNTLALSVLERTRELGLLRAVGMSRRQVRRMIRWESVIIALIGGVLGLSVGLVFGWALVRALADEGITSFTVPVGQLLIFLLLAGVAGILAAIGPARRAARLDILKAIAYE